MADQQGTPIDLANLPLPAVVEPLDFEGIYAAMQDQLAQLDPTLANLPDSDPVAKVLQVAAYRELNLRARINSAASAVMLTTATGTDLDNLVAKEPYNIQRLLLDPGNPSAVPPIAPTYETDAALRRRAQLAPRRYSTAGPTAAYQFWALGADADVADASVASPNPVEVVVTVLSRSAENGVPTQGVLDAVTRVLTDDNVRPLTDQVTVQAATPVDYSIDATLTLYFGPDQQVVEDAANAALDAYLTDTHKLGLDVTRAGIIAALYQTGVQNVELTSPAADIVIAPNEIAHLTSRSVVVSGRDE